MSRRPEPRCPIRIGEPCTLCFPGAQGPQDCGLVHLVQSDHPEGGTGVEHGLRARVVRFLQNLGYDESILAVYYEGLSKGESLLTVPCPAADRYRLGQVLIARGAHGVIYFGAGSAETLTAP